MNVVIFVVLTTVVVGAAHVVGDEDHRNIHSEQNLQLMAATNTATATRDEAENTMEYWYKKSTDTINTRKAAKENNKVAKNVIMFLGDGMSVTTVTAARIYLGQLNNKTGEEEQLSFEKFPYTGLSKTYCVDSQVADSACSVTAYLSGVKTNIATIGVTADVAYRNASAMLNPAFHTTSICEWAQAAAKATGIVTTTAVTDASPTGCYAHTACRHWESDQDIINDIGDNTSGVQDIARQLVENSPGNNFKVILGGGRAKFLPTTSGGERGDSQNLADVWRANKTSQGYNATYVTTRDELLSVNVLNTDNLMGLFTDSHMDYYLKANLTVQPTLAEMTKVAIEMLQKEDNGFFLFVEGGRIDQAHHSNWAHLSLAENVEFHKAIEVAVSMTSEEDTLIVVTADHAHTLTLAGYPSRGANLFTTLQSTTDGLFYSTLSYANGKSGLKIETDGTNYSHHNLSEDTLNDTAYQFPATWNLGSETHGGEDVGVWARGPSAHLLTGNYEQTVIAHVMGYAARIGPAVSAINDTTEAPTALTTTKSQASTGTVLPRISTRPPSSDAVTSSAKPAVIPLLAVWSLVAAATTVFKFVI